MLIASPTAQLNTRIIEVRESAFGELSTLGNNLCTHVIFHALRREVLRQFKELVNKDGLKVTNLHLELLIDLRQTLLVAELL